MGLKKMLVISIAASYMSWTNSYSLDKLLQKDKESIAESENRLEFAKLNSIDSPIDFNDDIVINVENYNPKSNTKILIEDMSGNQYNEEYLIKTPNEIILKNELSSGLYNIKLISESGVSEKDFVVTDMKKDVQIVETKSIATGEAPVLYGNFDKIKDMDYRFYNESGEEFKDLNFKNFNDRIVFDKKMDSGKYLIKAFNNDILKDDFVMNVKNAIYKEPEVNNLVLNEKTIVIEGNNIDWRTEISLCIEEDNNLRDLYEKSGMEIRELLKKELYQYEKLKNEFSKKLKEVDRRDGKITLRHSLDPGDYFLSLNNADLKSKILKISV